MKQNVKFAIIGALMVLVFVGGIALGRISSPADPPARNVQVTVPETISQTTPETILTETEAPETEAPETTETAPETTQPETIPEITAPTLPINEVPPFSKDAFTLRFIPKLEQAGAKRIEISVYREDTLLGVASFDNGNDTDLKPEEYDFTLTRQQLGKKPVELGLTCTVIYAGDVRAASSNRLKLIGDIGKSYPFIISSIAGEHYLAAADFE